MFEIDAANVPMNSAEGAACDQLQLVGLITYYGKHYSAFLFHSALNTWLYLDDANVRDIGPSWPLVLDKCVKSHLQPLLLLYSSAQSPLPNMSEAPSATIPLILNKAATNVMGSRQPHPPQHFPEQAPKCGALKQQLTRIMGLSGPQKQLSASELSAGVANVSALAARRSVSTHLPILAKPDEDAASPLGAEDVPDSPFAKCSTASSAYFSDASSEQPMNTSSDTSNATRSEMKDHLSPEQTAYISRKTVKNILQMHRGMDCDGARGSRNSSSSIDSFTDNMLRRNSSSNLAPLNELTLDEQRKIQAYYSQYAPKLTGEETGASVAPESTRNASSTGNGTESRTGMDPGYDSYSLSSSDSFPSVWTGGRAALTSNASSDSSTSGSTSGFSSQADSAARLCAANGSTLNGTIKRTSQPEDQLLQLLNNSELPDCDKLCSESDILLLRSHEKEREGELRTAATLSDVAAQKARAAMDAPSSNAHTLISAKMKHSMCVMRSAALHRRLREEDEEKRREKRMARAASRDKLNRSNEHLSTLANPNDTVNNNAVQVTNNHITSQAPKALQIYGTLPKKNYTSRKKSASLSMITPCAPAIGDQVDGVAQTVLPLVASTPATDIRSEGTTETAAESCAQAVANKVQRSCSISSASSVQSTNQLSDVSTVAGAPIEEDTAALDAADPKLSKQHKIRKKLLIGGFMRRKNRSLPDLREGQKPEVNASTSTSTNDSRSEVVVVPPVENPTSPAIAKVSRKGFHQIYAENQSKISGKPGLLKVNPPLIDRNDLKTPPKPVVLPKPTLTGSKRPASNVDEKNERSSTATPPLPPPPSTSISLLPLDIEVVPNQCSSIDLPKASLASISVETSDELPPPPEHFLQDLRENRFYIQTKERSQDEQTNVQNENLENHMMEIRASGSCDQVDAMQPQCTANKSVRNLTSKFEQIATQKTLPSLVSNNTNPAKVTVPPPVAPRPTIPSSKRIKQLPPLPNNSTELPPPPPPCQQQSVTTTIDSLTNQMHQQLQLNSNSQSLQQVAPVRSLSSSSAQSHSNHLPNIAIVASHHHHQPQQSHQLNGSHSYHANGPPSPLSPTQIQTLQNTQINSGKSGFRVALMGTSLSRVPSNASASMGTTLSNSQPSGGSSSSHRPDRPPDYDTAIKRLGMMKEASNNSLSNSTNSHMSIGSNGLSSLNSSLDSPFKGSPIIPHQPLTKQQSMQLMAQQLNVAMANRSRRGPKKTVSFSDDVIVVAPAEDDEEEHLPNPLLQRVLGKNNPILAKND